MDRESFEKMALIAFAKDEDDKKGFTQFLMDRLYEQHLKLLKMSGDLGEQLGNS